MGHVDPVRSSWKWQRHLRRLREELIDESLPLPLHGPTGEALLEEILHARHPTVHEGRAGSYGSLVFSEDAWAWIDALRKEGRDTFIEISNVQPFDLRSFADGRTSFLVRVRDELLGLVCFNRTVEYDATLVDMQESSGAVIVQRTGYGIVRVYTADAVTIWDGVGWRAKPLAARMRDAILPFVPRASVEVLTGLLELCVHWLAPSQTGATVVWFLDSVDARSVPHLDLSTAKVAPCLEVTDGRHFGAMLGSFTRTDGAALVMADGQLFQVGAMLKASERAQSIVPPIRGSRHTSARRFSFDQPRTLVFVVSQDGPLSVFSDGARIALVRTEGPAAALPPAFGAQPDGPDAHVTCLGCGKQLALVASEAEEAEANLVCPVCERPIGGQWQAVRGVRKPARWGPSGGAGD